MTHLTEQQVRSVLVLMDLNMRIANDLVEIYLATAKQQPAAAVMPGEQMGMF